MLFFLLLTAETRALEVGIKIGTFGPLLPLFPFVEASVSFGERGQGYQHEVGIRCTVWAAPGVGVIEIVNRSWFSRATPEPESFHERLSAAVEYSPYLVVGREELRQGTALRAGLCGVNLKGCLSLFLGEGPDEVYHELFFTDGLYVPLFAFDKGTEFTLAPLDEGVNFAFYVPWWLSLGYGAGFGP